jgi:very-short-patch-repair endonuclease
MSDAERRLWFHLRLRQIDGAKFRKQAPIGRYIVDLVCFERNLVIELDGGQHAERIEEDAVRTSWLNSRGFRVIRFWNYVIFEDLEAVLESIGLALLATPHPNPPPQGGRESDIG